MVLEVIDDIICLEIKILNVWRKKVVLANNLQRELLIICIERCLCFLLFQCFKKTSNLLSLSIVYAVSNILLQSIEFTSQSHWIQKSQFLQNIWLFDWIQRPLTRVSFILGSAKYILLELFIKIVLVKFSFITVGTIKPNYRTKLFR